MPRILGKTVSRLLRAYYRGPAHPMKLRFWWGFRKMTNYPRLTIPYAGNGWITVDERDVISGFLFTSGAYEPEVWEALGAHATRGEVLWDIGANIGVVSVRAVLDPRIRAVHAFEPDPGNAAILEHNLSLNGGRYTVHRLALGSETEVRSLFVAPDANRGLSSLAVATSTGIKQEVQCRTADELVFAQGVEAPTLVKMDVEDWELHVLRGARRLLAERPPKAIAFEAACDEAGEIADEALAALFRDAGYSLSRIPRPDGMLETRENYLALRA